MRKHIRFAWGLHRYLRERVTPEEALECARGKLRARIEARAGNFVTLLEKGVFGYSQSPYRKLLESRRITLADVRKWVEADGVEPALTRLQQEGVYFTVDEFKGKIEVERPGVRFRCQERQFDNPFLSNYYEVRSGATRSAGTRIKIDFGYLTQRSFYDAFLLHTHAALTSPIANWFPIFPAAPGINSSLRFARIGNAPKRWFSQVQTAQVKVSREKTWGTEFIFLMSRLHGVPLARPEYASLNDARVVAEWASAMLDHHPNCVIYTFASSAVRVCMAAQEHGLNLKGVRFLVTGEPLTEQRRREIENLGAIAVPVYGISEAGVIAAGCNHVHDAAVSDHCHVYKDTTAIITHRHRVPRYGIEVESFLFTTQVYESPKLLLNVGMGDYGKLYSRPSACPFGQLGFDTHICNIRSYEKLTGEGVSLVDTDFVRIIETELPARFGGQSSDYQLVEAEDDRGLTRLHLLVSPRLGAVDESRMVREFIELLHGSEQHSGLWAQAGSAMWDQAGTIQVKREPPMSTRGGKILPFHLIKK